MSWKKISTKKILDHPRIQVYEDIVELPNGKQTDYVYVKTGDSTTIIGINDEGKILMQEEYNYIQDARMLEFPGGGFDPAQEDPEVAALREFQEETGYTGKLTYLGYYYADNRRKTQKMYVYVATELKHVGDNPDETEELEHFWFTPAEMDALIREDKIHTYSTPAGWAMFMNSDFYKP